MKIVFMGTPEVAAQCLQSLLGLFPISAIVTQPDRPRGRGLALTPSPVKVIALQEGLEVLEPLKMKEPGFVERLREIRPDLIVVVAYGGFLTETVLKIPLLGCVNLHSSLLPKYRGATPVQWALMNGETEVGWTTFYLTREMDAGDIIDQNVISVLADEDAEILFSRMIPMGIDLLKRTLQKVLDGKASRIPQDQNKASFAPKLTKLDGRIKWDHSASSILNRVRGLMPWPAAYAHFEWRGKSTELKIFKAKLESGASGEMGKILQTSEKGILVGTGDGGLWLKEVQKEGGRRMDAQDFLRGHPLSVGCVFR